MIQVVTSAVERNEISRRIFLHLIKAFDTIDHQYFYRNWSIKDFVEMF